MKPVAIQLALANTHGTVDEEQVYAFLESDGADLQTFKRAPPPPGAFYNHAVDFALIIGITANVLTVAHIFWTAYKEFIAPKKVTDESAGIVLIIQRDNGSSQQFWIGNLQKDEEIFIREFTKEVEEIRQTHDDEQSTGRLVTKLNSRQMWIRRK